MICAVELGTQDSLPFPLKSKIYYSNHSMYGISLYILAACYYFAMLGRAGNESGTATPAGAASICR